LIPWALARRGWYGRARSKNLPAPLADALNERIYVTIDGGRRKLTKREAIVTEIVNKSARARFARD